MKLDKNVDRFLKAVTERLHRRIHCPDFKNTLLQNVSRSWRHKIGSDINTQIETETQMWEKTIVNQIYEENVIQNFNDKLKIGPLPHYIKTGFEMAEDDQESKTIKRIVFSTVTCTIVGGLAVFFEQPVAGSVVFIGGSIAGLINGRYISDFRTVCKEEVDMRINKLSKTEIKTRIEKKYATVIKTQVKGALKSMKVEIEYLTQLHREREEENTKNTYSLKSWQQINVRVSECRKRLEDITKKCPPQVINSLTVF